MLNPISLKQNYISCLMHNLWLYFKHILFNIRWECYAFIYVPNYLSSYTVPTYSSKPKLLMSCPQCISGNYNKYIDCLHYLQPGHHNTPFLSPYTLNIFLLFLLLALFVIQQYSYLIKLELIYILWNPKTPSVHSPIFNEKRALFMP